MNNIKLVKMVSKYVECSAEFDVVNHKWLL